MTDHAKITIFATARKVAMWAAGALFLVVVFGVPAQASAQVRAENLPSTDRHVPELARHLERLQLSEPVIYRGLAVYTLQLIDGDTLGGNWLTLDTAISRGVLVVTEKGASGSVPWAMVENRSRTEHVFIMQGEVITGGKQTRTVRNDIVVAPGQKVELGVYCVEKHRWAGGKQFGAGGVLLPQSIRKELRKGADQARVWSEVARNNQALGAENSTGSLHRALKSKLVQDKLAEVRRKILPAIPRGTTGFLFVQRGRALGAELFGSEEMARALLPKLIDSYAVDFVLQSKAIDHWRPGDHSAAIAFYSRMRRVESRRSSTAGSGAGIHTRSDGVLGDGVSLGSTLVHYGLQVRARIIIPPKPLPIIPRPEPYRNNLRQQSRR